jgi:hypothetical protein
VENCGFPQRKKKKQKERNKGPWKLTSLMEIRKERGFPQRLEALRLHSSHRPDGGDKLKSGTFYFALTEQKLKEKGDTSNEVRKGTFLKSLDRPVD